MFAMTQCLKTRLETRSPIVYCLQALINACLMKASFFLLPSSSVTSILTVSLRRTMAPFFKSSSLLNISRRRRKDQKSLDTCVSPPPMVQSRSLPDLQELHSISASFLEEFRPFLQRQVVSTSSPLSEESTSLGASSSDFISCLN